MSLAYGSSLPGESRSLASETVTLPLNPGSSARPSSVWTCEFTSSPGELGSVSSIDRVRVVLHGDRGWSLSGVEV